MKKKEAVRKIVFIAKNGKLIINQHGEQHFRARKKRCVENESFCENGSKKETARSGFEAQARWFQIQPKGSTKNPSSNEGGLIIREFRKEKRKKEELLLLRFHILLDRRLFLSYRLLGRILLHRVHRGSIGHGWWRRRSRRGRRRRRCCGRIGGCVIRLLRARRNTAYEKC